MLKAFKEAWAPASKPSSAKPKPVVQPEAQTGTPVVPPPKTILPKTTAAESAPEPIAPKPIVSASTASKPASPKPILPKPAGPKPPLQAIELATRWAPRVLPVLTFLISYAMDEDGGWAGLWAIMIWSACRIARLKWLYPSIQTAAECSIAELNQKAASSNGRAVAIQLQGSLEDPRSKTLALKDASGVVALNRYSWMELLPRVFGVTSGSQFPDSDLTLRGWYRPGARASVEVHEVQGEKSKRVSLTKAVRWGSTILVFVFSILLLLLAS